MKLVNQSVELVEQEYNELNPLDSIYKQIEKAGRICYLSCPKNDASGFVNMLIEKEHYSPLEHGTVNLKFDVSEIYYVIPQLLLKNRYSKAQVDNDKLSGLYITTNYRVLVENNINIAKLNFCDDGMSPKRHTFHITTSIGIAREIMRHRNFSFSQESTRYCNYSKDKFNNEITFIAPYWLNEYCTKKLSEEVLNSMTDPTKTLYKLAKVDSNAANLMVFLNYAEFSYNNLQHQKHQGKYKLTAQDAREILPLCTKTELYMTGFDDDWKDFIDKRDIPQAHPMAREIAQKIKTILNI